MEAYAVPDQVANTVTQKLVDEFSAVSLSQVTSIQTKGNSLSSRLYLLSASYYRLKRSEGSQRAVQEGKGDGCK